MTNTPGVLRLQILKLETAASKLEQIVLSNLTALETMRKPSKAAEYEARILRKLHKLDDLQDQIDALTGELKATGEHVSVSHSGSVYEYKRPKQAKPAPKPRETATARVLTPKPKPRMAVSKPAQPKPRTVRPKPAPKPRKPAASPEVRAAKKRRDFFQRELRELETATAQARTKLEAKRSAADAKLAELADVGWLEHGPQRRRDARIQIANAERKLAELPERMQEKAVHLAEQIATLDQLISSLS